MLRKILVMVAVGVLALWAAASPAMAIMNAQSLPATSFGQGSDYLEARQYRLSDGHVPGGTDGAAMRQTVTAWEVTSGSWNGESLEGLTLVLVQNKPESGESAATTTNCYISHVATQAQRNALVSAFLAAQDLRGTEISSWRIEAAVIRFEVAGKTVILHLGLVA